MKIFKKYSNALVISLLLIFSAIVFTCVTPFFKGNSNNSEGIYLSKTELDSIIKRASTVKITVKDTVIYKEKIVFKDRLVPAPYIVNDSVKYYEDRIVNSEIDITIKDSVIGSLLFREFSYTPIIHVRETIIEKEIPFIVETKINPQYRGFILGVSGGITSKHIPVLGCEAGFMTQNRNIYSYKYTKMIVSGIDIHEIKFIKYIKL